MDTDWEAQLNASKLMSAGRFFSRVLKQCDEPPRLSQNYSWGEILAMRRPELEREWEANQLSLAVYGLTFGETHLAAIWQVATRAKPLSVRLHDTLRDFLHVHVFHERASLFYEAIFTDFRLWRLHQFHELEKLVASMVSDSTRGRIESLETKLIELDGNIDQIWTDVEREFPEVKYSYADDLPDGAPLKIQMLELMSAQTSLRDELNSLEREPDTANKRVYREYRSMNLGDNVPLAEDWVRYRGYKLSRRDVRKRLVIFPCRC